MELWHIMFGDLDMIVEANPAPLPLGVFIRDGSPSPGLDDRLPLESVITIDRNTQTVE
jgi:hypothetical protein